MEDKHRRLYRHAPGRPPRSKREVCAALETHTLGGGGKFFTASKEVENADIPESAHTISLCLLMGKPFWEWAVTTTGLG